MKIKRTIFLGGAYSAPKDSREKSAEHGKRIEKVIRACGFDPSLNLFSNPKVHKDTVNAKNIKFSDGEYFLDVGKDVVSVTKKEMELVHGLRNFNSEDEFQIKFMACNIALRELKKSVAGIFELSETSQGAYAEIYLALYVHEFPVLALTHGEYGRDFGTMLTGAPSPLLQTVRYQDEDLEGHVKKFLTEDLPEKKLKVISFRAASLLETRMRESLSMNGFKNTGELARRAIEEYLVKKGHK